MKTDIFDKEPKVGDRIVFNPPKYKGLMVATFIGFNERGLVKVTFSGKITNYSISRSIEEKDYYTLKTEFVIVNE